jgi:hypothetical protein
MNSIVVKIEQEFPDLHLIHLSDGRVIGINAECVVLYSDIDDVYEGGLKDRQTIKLYEGK